MRQTVDICNVEHAVLEVGCVVLCSVPEPRPWQEVEDASGYAAQLRRRASQTPPMGKGFRVDNDVSDAAVTQNRVARTEAPSSAVGVGAARL